MFVFIGGNLLFFFAHDNLALFNLKNMSLMGDTQKGIPAIYFIYLRTVVKL